MTDIVTFTINPAVDISTSVDRVIPSHKLRCAVTRRDAGGGGINVARVVKRFGADVLSVYTTGGPIGDHLRCLVDQEGIRSLAIPIRGDTREDLAVVESETGEQYRFVLPGPALAESEWRTCLDALASIEGKPRFLVASGSLPPGVPDDFYGRLVMAMRASGAKVIVDTSGVPLKRALDAGVYLIKPNLRELRELVGRAAGARNGLFRGLAGAGGARPCRGGGIDARPSGRAPGNARSGVAGGCGRHKAGEHGRRRRQLPGRIGDAARGRPRSGGCVSLCRGGRFGRAACAGH